jgi:hypothetical protein
MGIKIRQNCSDDDYSEIPDNEITSQESLFFPDITEFKMHCTLGKKLYGEVY